MANTGLEPLLTPLDGDSPAGPNLEYDPDFQALERAATPKAAQSVGNNVIGGEEPEWGDVADRAIALLARTKDLRVAIHLGIARLHTMGLPGWSSSLELIRRFLEEFWDGVHPQLDAEDDDDPTFRVNSLAPLGDVNGVPGASSNHGVRSVAADRSCLAERCPDCRGHAEAAAACTE